MRHGTAGSSSLLDTVKECRADILIAGGRNLYTALKARLPFLDINQEREFGYAGYDGMLELVRQLALTIESPVWQAVRKPAPWTAAQPALAPPAEILDSIEAGEEDDAEDPPSPSVPLPVGEGRTLPLPAGGERAGVRGSSPPTPLPEGEESVVGPAARNSDGEGSVVRDFVPEMQRP
jgi:hypothetical protein